MCDDPSAEQCMAEIHTMSQGADYKDYTSKQKLLEEALSEPWPAEQLGALTWGPIKPQGTASFWERTEAPLPPLRPRPKQLSPFLDRLELPILSEGILSGFEDTVSTKSPRG